MHELLEGRRVLLVEDEMLVLMMEEDMLGDLGCRDIVSAASTEQALDCIKTSRFDLAILDMNLNGEESTRVADALSEGSVPFAFATGHGGRTLRPQDRYRPVLSKPFQLHHMRRVVTGLLDGSPTPPPARA